MSIIPKPHPYLLSYLDSFESTLPNIENIFSRSFSGIPIPVSMTLIYIIKGCYYIFLAFTFIYPTLVNFKAFPNKFITIYLSLAGSLTILKGIF